MMVAAPTPHSPTSPLLLLLLGVALATLLLGLMSGRFRRHQRTPLIGALRPLGALPILLGFSLGPSGFGLLDAALAARAAPLFMLACAWVALLVGLQAQGSVLVRVPRVLWGWVFVDLAIAVLLAAAAVAWLALVHSGEAPSALIPIGLAIFVFFAGWNPETRSLRVHLAPASGRLATLVQAGSGLAGLLSLALASVGTPGSWGGELVRALLCAIGLLLAAWLILGANVSEERRQIMRFTVLLGLVGFVAGSAPMIGVGPMLLALVVGIVAANVRGPFVKLESTAQRVEPLAAWAINFGAGFYGTALGGWWWLLLPLALAALRHLLKPPLMFESLRTSADCLDTRSPLMQASTRPAPLATAFALSLSLVSDAPQVRALLLAIATSSLLVAVTPLLLASLRRLAPQLPGTPATADDDDGDGGPAG